MSLSSNVCVYTRHFLKFVFKSSEHLLPLFSGRGGPWWGVALVVSLLGFLIKLGVRATD
jgi:hypothetical protein